MVLFHTQDESLSSALSCLQAESIKLKLEGLKGVFQYFSNQSNKYHVVDPILIAYVTASVVQCMGREFTKRTLSCVENTQKTSKLKRSISLTLAHQFELVVKLLSTRYFSLDPKSAVPLVDHIVLTLQHYGGTVETQGCISWETSYASSLSTLISSVVVIQYLTSETISGLARLLLQRNCTNDVRPSLHSLPFARRVELATLVFTHAVHVNRQRLLHAVCARIGTSFAEEFCHQESEVVLSTVCHCIYQLIYTLPVGFLAVLRVRPSLWVAMNHLSQQWLKFLPEAQFLWIRVIRMIITLLKCPKALDDGHCFYRTIIDSMISGGPAAQLLTSMRSVLWSKLHTLLSDDIEDDDSLTDKTGGILASLSFADSAASVPAAWVNEELQPFDTTTQLHEVADLLSDLVLELDVVREIPQRASFFLSSPKTSRRLFQTLMKLGEHEQNTVDIRVFTLGCYAMRRLAMQGVPLSIEAEEEHPAVVLLRRWHSQIQAWCDAFAEPQEALHRHNSLHYVRLAVTGSLEAKRFQIQKLLKWSVAAFTSVIHWSLITTGKTITVKAKLQNDSISGTPPVWTLMRNDMIPFMDWLLAYFFDMSLRSSSSKNPTKPSTWLIQLLNAMVLLTPPDALCDRLQHRLELMQDNSKTLHNAFGAFPSKTRLLDSEELFIKQKALETIISTADENSCYLWFTFFTRLPQEAQVLRRQLRRALSLSCFRVLPHALSPFFYRIIFYMYRTTTVTAAEDDVVPKGYIVHGLPHSNTPPCHSLFTPVSLPQLPPSSFCVSRRSLSGLTDVHRKNGSVLPSNFTETLLEYVSTHYSATVVPWTRTRNLPPLHASALNGVMFIKSWITVLRYSTVLVSVLPLIEYSALELLSLSTGQATSSELVSSADCVTVSAAIDTICVSAVQVLTAARRWLSTTTSDGSTTVSTYSSGGASNADILVSSVGDTAGHQRSLRILSAAINRLRLAFAVLLREVTRRRVFGSAHPLFNAHASVIAQLLVGLPLGNVSASSNTTPFLKTENRTNSAVISGLEDVCDGHPAKRAKRMSRDSDEEAFSLDGNLCFKTEQPDLDFGEEINSGDFLCSDVFGAAYVWGLPASTPRDHLEFLCTTDLTVWAAYPTKEMNKWFRAALFRTDNNDNFSDEAVVRTASNVPFSSQLSRLSLVVCAIRNAVPAFLAFFLNGYGVEAFDILAELVDFLIKSICELPESLGLVSPQFLRSAELYARVFEAITDLIVYVHNVFAQSQPGSKTASAKLRALFYAPLPSSPIVSAQPRLCRIVEQLRIQAAQFISLPCLAKVLSGFSNVVGTLCVQWSSERDSSQQRTIDSWVLPELHAQFQLFQKRLVESIRCTNASSFIQLAYLSPVCTGGLPPVVQALSSVQFEAFSSLVVNEALARGMPEEHTPGCCVSKTELRYLKVLFPSKQFGDASEGAWDLLWQPFHLLPLIQALCCITYCSKNSIRQNALLCILQWVTKTNSPPSSRLGASPLPGSPLSFAEQQLVLVQDSCRRLLYFYLRQYSALSAVDRFRLPHWDTSSSVALDMLQALGKQRATAADRPLMCTSEVLKFSSISVWDVVLKASNDFTAPIAHLIATHPELAIAMLSVVLWEASADERCAHHLEELIDAVASGCPESMDWQRHTGGVVAFLITDIPLDVTANYASRCFNFDTTSWFLEKCRVFEALVEFYAWHPNPRWRLSDLLTSASTLFAFLWEQDENKESCEQHFPLFEAYTMGFAEELGTSPVCRPVFLDLLVWHLRAFISHNASARIDTISAVLQFQLLYNATLSALKELLCTTRENNSDVTQSLVKLLLDTIQTLPADTVKMLLTPSDVPQSQNENSPVLPCSLYWFLMEMLVTVLAAHSGALHHSSASPALSYPQLQAASTASAIWTIPAPRQTSFTAELEELIKPFILILEALLTRQLEQRQTASAFRRDVRRVLHFGTAGVLRILGYELVFLFPPLHAAASNCRLSLETINAMVGKLAAVCGRCCVPWLKSEQHPLLHPKDVRFMLNLMTHSSERKSFFSVFQHHYVQPFFSWLLYYFDATDKELPLLTRIFGMTANFLAETTLTTENKACCQAQNFFVSADRRNTMQEILYNLARQPLALVAQSFSHLTTGTPCVCPWVSSVQRHVTVPLFFHILRSSSENSPLSDIAACCSVVRCCGDVLRLDCASVCLACRRAAAERLATGPLSLPCCAVAEERQPPWPVWLAHLLPKSVVRADTFKNLQPSSVLTALRQWCSSPEFWIEAHPKKETLKLYWAGPEALETCHNRLFFAFVTGVWVYLEQSSAELQQRCCPELIRTAKAAISSPELYALQFPLILWAYIALDVEAQGCSSFSADNMRCATLIETLCTSFLAANHREAYPAMAQLICGVIATHRLAALLLGATTSELRQRGNLERNLRLFLSQLNLELLARTSFEIGLFFESHFLLHLHAWYRGYASFCPGRSLPSPFSSKETNKSRVSQHVFPPLPNTTLLLLVSSLHQLGVLDVFHGTLCGCLDPIALAAEATAKQAHWKTLILALSRTHNPVMPQYCSPRCLLSTAGNPSSWLRPASEGLGWWQSAGLLEAFPLTATDSPTLQKRHEWRVEWLWRLGDWLPKNTSFDQDTGFHGTLRHALYLVQKRFDVLPEKHKVREQLTPKDAPAVPQLAHRDAQQATLYTETLHQTLRSLSCCIILDDDNFTNCRGQLNYVFKKLAQQLIIHALHDVADDIDEQVQSKHSELWIDDIQNLSDTLSLFTLFEPLITFRRNLLTMLWRFSSRSKEHMTEKSHINVLRYEVYRCAGLRLQGFQDAAVVAALDFYQPNAAKLTPASTIAESPDNTQKRYARWLSSWHMIKTLYDANDTQRALALAPSLANDLRHYILDNTLCSTLEPADLQLGALVLSTVGKWMFVSQWETFDAIEQHYLLPAIVASDRLATNSHTPTQRNAIADMLPHRNYATLLDEIVQIQERQRFSKDSVIERELFQSLEQELNLTLKEIAAVKNRSTNKSSAIHALETERIRLEESLSKQKQKSQEKQAKVFELSTRAVRHYLTWLRSAAPTHHETLQATTRVLSLWFNYGSSGCNSVNKAISAAYDSSSNTSCVPLLAHVRHFVYQIASRIQQSNVRLLPNDDNFQNALRVVLKNLIIRFPFNALFPLLLLQNGDNVPLDHRGKDRFVFHAGQIQAARQIVVDATAPHPAHDPRGYLRLLLDSCSAYSSFFIHLGILQPNALSSNTNDTSLQLHKLPLYSSLQTLATILPVPTASTHTHRSIPPFDPLSVELFQNEKSAFCETQKSLWSVPIPSSQFERDINSDHQNAKSSFGKLQYYIQHKLRLPTIARFDSLVQMIPTGLSRPRIVSLWDSAGLLHKQVVKGRDDLRPDAVMEQLFYLLNCAFMSIPQTRERALGIRTYQVVPLSPVVGIAQWVTGTVTLDNFLLGSAQQTDTASLHGMHTRYYPTDLSHGQARDEMQTAWAATASAVDKSQRNASLLKAYLNVCERFHPVMHLAFFDVFPSPQHWLTAIQRYTRSLAVTSMIGYLLGIGDRHTNNILIDLRSGELVHIDFGVVFDRGKTLAIPEVVPFRLTRDMLAGLGPLGIEGIFRATCEMTLEVLREIHSLVTSIVEVFLFDPLYLWALCYRKALAQQRLRSKNALPASKDQNNQGRAALLRVRQKLLGICFVNDEDDVLEEQHYAVSATPFVHQNGESLPISSLVNRLLRQAASPHRLSQMFTGWAPWV